MRKHFLFSSLVLLLLTSCSTTLYQPVNNINNTLVEDLKKGRELYVNNCASCHQLYMPNKYTDEKWKINLDEMQVRAKITNSEKELIYQYIINVPK